MSFDANRFAANLMRASEPGSLDSIAVDKSLAVLRELKTAVGRWGIWETELVKLARAIVERKISPVKVGELIETVLVRQRTLPRDHKFFPRNPGAFFLTSVRRELARLAEADEGEA